MGTATTREFEDHKGCLVSVGGELPIARELEAFHLFLWEALYSMYEGLSPYLLWRYITPSFGEGLSPFLLVEYNFPGLVRVFILSVVLRIPSWLVRVFHPIFLSAVNKPFTC